MAHLGAKAFDQRHQVVVESLVLLARCRVRVMVGGIKSGGGDRGHGAAALGVGAHGHEHAAHIGVVNDRRSALHGAVHRAALHPVFGKLSGLLVGAFGHRNALHTHRKTGRIHHDEHVLQAAVFFTHDIAHSAPVIAILQHGRGAGLDTQLVLDAHAMHVVARAQAAVFVDQHLGHEEERNALDAFGCTAHPRQHRVDDVGGVVVLAVGDENLGAKQLVAAIGLRLGAGAHSGQVATGLRLGQVHGASPFATHQFFQVGSLQLVGGGGEHGFNRTVSQHGAQGKAQVGALHHLAAQRANGFRQALAAPTCGVLQTLPAAVHVLFVSVFETLGGGDLTVFEPRGIAVALHVQRGHHLLAELGAFFQHGLCGVQTGVFKTRELGNLLDACQMLQVEQHVFDRGDVTHFLSPKR